MEILKSASNVCKSVWGFLQSRATVWQMCLAIISYQAVCKFAFGGVGFFSWVKIATVSGGAYLGELAQNAPIIGAMFK